MKIYTKWWPGFNNPYIKITLTIWIGLLSLFPKLNAQTYPDFRHVCAQGIGNDINLSWSPLSDTCAGFQKLYIYGRVDALQPFKLIDSIGTINQTQYMHVGAKLTSTTWNYFLVYKFLCNGDSAFSKTLAIDFTQPGNSVIDSVSVDINTGKVVVGWRPNPAPDLMAYVVWRNQGVNNVPIDTITPTFFIHNGSTPETGVQSYTLTAVDSCFNQSVINTTHRTMFLQHQYDTCAKTINLSWSAYVGWSNILAYDVFAKNGDGNFKLVSSKNGSILTHSFTNFKPGDTLDFYIQAKDGTNGFTSSSNRISLITRGRKFSSRNYISYATVVDSNTVELKILGDAASDVKQFVLYRKEDVEGFFKLTTIPYDGTSTSLTYQDKLATPYMFPYEYKVISQDVCDENLDTSNVAKTIYLSILTDIDGNHLTWTRYGNWNAGVNQYSVFRGFDFGSGFTWNSINTTPNTDSLSTDNNFPLDIGLAGTCYYIEADELGGNVFGEQSTSKSNTICVVEDAIIHFPNAFAPDHVNTLFLPKGVNIDYKRSNMQIYARNGQLIKNIDNISNGWDGTNLDGAQCTSGVYLYICEVFGLNEKKYNFKGTVHLLQ